MRAGRLIALSPVRSLLDHARHRLELTFAETVSPGLLRGVPGVVDVTADGSRLDVVIDGAVGPVLAAATADSTVLRVASVGDELEDMFFAEARP